MDVKYKPSITDSPAHFYNQIRRQAQYFSGDLLKVLQKNLQTNSSSTHPDNILVGMVACDDPVRREGAVMMILKIRDLPTIGGIWEYILPKLLFKSSSFKSMIKFHNETGRRPTYTAWNGKKLPVTEPPLLMKKTRDELLSYVDTPFSSDYPSPPVPHSKGRDWCEAHNSRSCQSCRPEAPSWRVFDSLSVPQEVSWKSYPKAV